MSANNGVIRIGRKGLKKFAFGEEGTPEGTPFEVDVVVAFQQWMMLDDSFRPAERNEEGHRPIPLEVVPEFHKAAVVFVSDLAKNPHKHSDSDSKPLTVAEALDFIARLREEYDKLADFFVPKSFQEPDSPSTSEAGFRFSTEESTETAGAD